MKLNLGCGRKHFPGFVNIDCAGTWEKKPDLECDIRKLPYGNGVADEIVAIHVIEHFYLWEVPDILKEWARVLKPGGRLVLELPCFNKVLKYLAQPQLDVSMTMYALYGDPRYKKEAMCHHWCYSREHMTQLLSVDFRQVTEEKPLFHVPSRDMRLIGIK